jgi:hypothetical protein
MSAFRLAPKTKKIAFVLFMSVIAAIVVGSGILLVKSAKLHTGPVPGLVATPTASALSVKPASETPFAASDTGASATLQGASPNAVATNTDELSSASGVTVQQVTQGTKMVCDAATQVKLMDGYAAKKTKEDNYHKSLLKYLGLEGQLMISNEISRYTTALSKLKATLNTSLAGIACPLVQ